MKNKISRRLDSIKAAHESEKAISSRVEDYLEVISELVDMKGYAATLDISRYMNVSAPSVTKMLKKLDADGYLIYEKYYGINLTGEGQRIADIIKQKHGILLEFFEILGIGKEIANQDAEGIEHYLNPKTIRQIRKFVTFFKANPKVLNSFNEF
ncbi:MAG: transcriptional regulator [Candidatus Nitrosopelagicus sp.]|jgi:Mn-dependent DtxR family transcriptional regulator|nr:transcriptional regulator [Candidatus Nitrosopelagicus sp.]MBT3761896.1 transcriptional regulator [Candidatus Nitrosopelagicus sp.]MBT4327073.1 transcriptional regulator [Candidatus Nitrosopelagicus sp.]MBT4455133.1 transcriptional regulator [Candidatus Nitrosopelagicus sp.]MBT5170956.1 transcriptional regulator [Candidatus Nitrosopelagicus sp.]|tara:strand:+ start:1008 stop:1469 length:462 start_codon:yes stop_codon:yes gene_type:complete